MKRRQRRSWKQRRLAPPVARRHQPKSQSTALHPSFHLLFYLLRPLDCLLFVSCTPDDLTHIFLLNRGLPGCPRARHLWLSDQLIKKRTRVCFYLLAPFHYSEEHLRLAATRNATKS